MTKKERLIEKHRDINVEYDWWEFVEQDFKDEMAEQGIYVSQLAFDLHVQGAGASFKGDINHKVFMGKHFNQDEYPVVWHLLELGGQFSIKVDLSHRSVHSRGAQFENCFYGFEYSEAAEFGEEHVQFWNSALESIEDQFFDDCEAAIREHMDDLYEALDAEYEHLISDKAVWEAILAQGWDKEEDDEEEAA
jgi:hypothetical protein